MWIGEDPSADTRITSSFVDPTKDDERDIRPPIRQAKRMSRIRVTEEVMLDWWWQDRRYVKWAWMRLKYFIREGR